MNGLTEPTCPSLLLNLSLLDPPKQSPLLFYCLTPDDFTRQRRASAVWVGILHVYNIWNPVIRIVIYLVVRKFVDFLANVNGSDVKPGIFVTVNQGSN